MSASPTLTVLSLGGGVQSSVMALMAGEGAFDRVPDCAIFADTHLGAAQRLRAHRVAQRPAELPPARPLHVVDNGSKPPRGREGPHQPLLPHLSGLNDPR